MTDVASGREKLPLSKISKGKENRDPNNALVTKKKKKALDKIDFGV